MTIMTFTPPSTYLLSLRPFRKAMLLAIYGSIALFNAAPVHSIAYDPTNTIHNYGQLQKLKETYDHLKKQYERQLDQLEKATQTLSSLTSDNDLGDLLNSTIEQDLRRVLPTDIQDLLGLSTPKGLVEANSAMQDLHKDIHDMYQPTDIQKLYPNENDKIQASSHQQHSQAAHAAMAVSKYDYKLANKRVENYEEFMRNLNDSPDVKASIDLLARITTENGLLLNDIARANAVNMQMIAAEHSEAIAEKERVNIFMRYNDLETDKEKKNHSAQ